MGKNKRYNQQRVNPVKETNNNGNVDMNKEVVDEVKTETNNNQDVVNNEEILNNTEVVENNNNENKTETTTEENKTDNNDDKKSVNKTKGKTIEELIEEAKKGPARSTALGIERYIKNSTSAGVDIKKIGNAQYDLYRTMISTLRKDGREFKDGITLIEKAFILRPDIFNSVALLRGELEWPGTVDSRNQYAVLVVMFEEISHPNKRRNPDISMDKVYEYLPEKAVENLRNHYRLG